MDCAIKKKPGRLNLSHAHISWQANDGSTNESVRLADVKGMQATPPTAAKMRVKLTMISGQALMLEFSSAAELEKAKNALQSAIKMYREETTGNVTQAAKPAPPDVSANSAPVPTATDSPAAAPKPAQPAAVKKTKARKISLDPAKLLQNLDLQRTILRQDPELMKTFQQTVIATGALTNEQFWSLRVHLLVTAAQQQIQTRGSYNVLSTIKPTTGSDNKVNINLTREKISDMFDQYPLVRKAYNDNVPAMSEGEFWQRFFMSRLFLVLRGEKVSQTHSTDAVLDRYIDILHDLQAKRAKKIEDDHNGSGSEAPLFVNVEANDNNNPETYGNNIVTTAGGGTKNLIRSVNGLSQRLLLGKRKRDQQTQQQQDQAQSSEQLVDIHTKKLQKQSQAEADELKLRDLESADNNDYAVELHIDSLRAASNSSSENNNMDQQAFDQMNLQFIQRAPSQVDLSVVADDPQSLGSALNAVVALTTQNENVAADRVVSSDVQLVHATTQEFLRQFWNAYKTNKEQCLALREFLQKSLERIAAVQTDDLLIQLITSVRRALEVPIS